MSIQAINENTCMLYFGDEISEATAQKVRSALQRIKQDLAHCLIDVIPSYHSIMVSYDLSRVDRFAIQNRLKAILAQEDDNHALDEQENEVIIPVYYGPEVAIDLTEISQHCGLSPEQVIQLHSGRPYRVYAIGFAPGFAYLGNTDSCLKIPRKATPRLKVPAGSVGIADNQTAIYPSGTPGGWQILGRTPTPMVDKQRESLSLVEVGNRVRFQPITRDEFLELGGTLDGI